MRGGLQLAPPGRWWDDKGFAKSLGLRPEQRKKMDDIFNANKGTILLRYQSLQQEEAHLEDITREPQLNEPTIFAAIDRVAQARAALEKANAHMLLLIRQEMDKDQTERLEQHR
jgi:Spy/CpxP family protein refolding chaperone